MEQTSVVVDMGSACCKAGWAGENFPSARVPSFVGYFPSSENPGTNFRQVKAMNYPRNIRNLPAEFAIHRGTITDWDSMEFLWNRIFWKLQSQATDHPLLLTGLVLNDERCWQKVTEVMMETFNVPSLYIGNQAELALFGSGLLTGLVLDCGAGLTRIAPILEGQMIPKCTLVYELGGVDISSLLYKSIFARETVTLHVSEREAMEDLKEKLCYVTKIPDWKKSSSDLSAQRKVSVLPDGSIVSLTEKQLTYPDALFRPSQFGLPGEELSNIIITSALSCGWHFKSIISNVVLSGGSTLFNGFPERLFWDLRRARRGSWRVDVISQPNRINLPWIGGSMLSCLSSYKSSCITRENYNEAGAVALQQDAFFTNISTTGTIGGLMTGL